MSLKVLVCDDESPVLDQWQKELIALDLNIEVIVEPIDFLKGVVQGLENRRINAKGAHQGDKDSKRADVLDGIDVLVVDYDLLELNHSAYLTGENVAYLARCYSRCGFILAMNQFGRNSFDLKMTGHIESFADLNIGSEQLNNRNLWGGQAPGFNPWYWPSIENWIAAQRQRYASLDAGLETPVFEHLGFNSEELLMMPLAISEWISPRGEEKELNRITFDDVVRRSPLGVHEKDVEGMAVDQLKWVVSSRVSKWLERLVLPSQEYLIDPPHLALRFPSLVQNRQLPDCVKNMNPSDYLRVNEELRRFAFEKKEWLTKPAWWISRLKENNSIQEVSNPWEAEFFEKVFCEDTSCFCQPDEARSFVAELPTASPQRWVKKEDGVEYNPSVRFAL